jgi:SNF2 family DNA or RNA helicase
MSSKAKQESIDKFQNNKKTKVFIGNITSAGVGITLTEATVVIFNSFSWVPGDNEQAEDRSYRIGQKNNVSVYYQLFRGTISLMMWYSVMSKQKNIDEILTKGDKHSERMANLLGELKENDLKL